MAVPLTLANTPDTANIGAFSDGYVQTLISAATTTATDTTAVLTLPYLSVNAKAKLVVVVTALSGTSPTIQADYFESADGTNFNGTAAVTSGSISATGTTWGAVNSGPVFNQGRIKITIGGTGSPSATYSVYLVAWNR